MLNEPAVVDVPLRADDNGVIRIGDTRVTLLTLIGCHQRGDTAEQIHIGFPTVPLSDIYAVIAYYLAHQKELDAWAQHIYDEADLQRQAREANDPKAQAFNARMRELINQKRSPESD
jgi:uncharacterized protein (DUF433 family)